MKLCNFLKILITLLDHTLKRYNFLIGVYNSGTIYQVSISKQASVSSRYSLALYVRRGNVGAPAQPQNAYVVVL